MENDESYDSPNLTQQEKNEIYLQNVIAEKGHIFGIGALPKEPHKTLSVASCETPDDQADVHDVLRATQEKLEAQRILTTQQQQISALYNIIKTNMSGIDLSSFPLSGDATQDNATQSD